jgi:hypothetical protein
VQGCSTCDWEPLQNIGQVSRRGMAYIMPRKAGRLAASPLPHETGLHMCAAGQVHTFVSIRTERDIL